LSGVCLELYSEYEKAIRRREVRIRIHNKVHNKTIGDDISLKISNVKITSTTFAI
jgi:hypothetical protein